VSWLRRLLALLISRRVLELEQELSQAHHLARIQAQRIEELELHVLCLQAPQAPKAQGDTW